MDDSSEQLAYIRSKYAKELKNPRVIDTLSRLIAGEDPQNPHAFVESIFNRADARKQSLAETMKTDYYPSKSYNNGRYGDTNTIIDHVMNGSNEAMFATGNQSYPVKSGGAEITGRGRNKEEYVIENPDRRWSTDRRNEELRTAQAGPMSADDVLRAYGIKPSGTENRQPRGEETKTADDILKLYGVSATPRQATPPPSRREPGGLLAAIEANPGREAAMPGGAAAPVTPQEPARGTIDTTSEAAQRVAGNVGGNIADAYRGARDQYLSGIEALMGGRLATGLVQAASGLGGEAISPLTGLAHSLGQGVTNVSGNPEIGQRAEIVASLFGPQAAAGGVNAIRGAASTLRAPSVALPSLTPEQHAIDLFIKQIGPENVPNVLQRLRTNPELSIADAADVVRQSVQGLAADSSAPRAARTVIEAAKRREAEGPGLVNSAYDTVGGKAPNIVDAIEGLKSRAQTVGRAKIEPALANAKPVDTSAVIKAIDEELKPGITGIASSGHNLTLSPTQQELVTLRKKLVDDKGSALVDPNRLHEIQSETGTRAYNLMTGSSGADRNLGYDLRNVNEMLVDAIDTASGGAYRPARAAYKDAKSIEDAFMEGFDVLKNRQGAAGFADRPESLAARVKTMSPEQVEAMKMAVRSDIDQKIHSVANEVRAGTTITKIDYNRKKLTTLFGEKEAGYLVGKMENASDRALTNQKILHGSKTAETQNAIESMRVPPIMPEGKEGGGAISRLIHSAASGEAINYFTGAGRQGAGAAAIAAGAAGLKGVQLAGRAISHVTAKSRNNAFARMAMEPSGPERARILNAIEAAAQKRAHP